MIKFSDFNLGQLLMSRLVNWLLWQLRTSNFEQLLISRIFSSLSEQLSVIISGQRLRFKFLILLLEQLSSMRLLTSSSFKWFPAYSADYGYLNLN